MSSTCLRDRDMVLRLNRQLREHNIDHYLFVEELEFERFKVGLDDDVNLRPKPNGGDNGLGRGGALNRWACHQQMLAIVGEDDTFANIDSDVVFVNPKLIAALECQPGETKGFADHNPTVIPGASFNHMSGMVMVAHGALFHKAVSVSRDELHALCEPIMAIDVSPSDDVMLSYLFQVRAAATSVVNFHDFFTRNTGKRYELTDVDVIC
ncbi:MAG: hypothetical protein V4550_18280 [Gemmatimonadota bacterium]